MPTIRQRETGSPVATGRIPALLSILVLTVVVPFLVPAGAGPAAAFPASAPWGSPEHGYRLPLDVSSPTGGTDLTAVAAVDFTQAFVQAGAAGATFDPATLAVHEVDAAGAVLDDSVPFQFDPGAGYDATASAVGELVVFLAGPSAAGTERHVAVYFDRAGTVTTPSTFDPLVAVDGAASDEGRPAALVTTADASWYYDLAGGAFSSLLDVQGNDWIDWHPTGGAAGSYRGIPNLVYPEGHFHPGSSSSTTTIDAAGPVRAVLTSTTADGWSMRWEIFATHARGTVLAADGNYWFLYEGTPGGTVATNVDFYILADGTKNLLHRRFTADLVGEEWVAFADPGVARSLFLANHTDDTSVDSYRTLGGEMTVFGFGRDGTTPTMSGTGRSFSVGFVEAIDHAGVAPTIRGAAAPPVAAVGVAQANVPDTAAPVVSGMTVTPVGPDAVQLTWSTDEGATSVVDHGLTDGYELGSTPTPGYALLHDVTISGLDCDTEHHFRVVVTDASTNATTVDGLTATTGLCSHPVDVSVSGDGSVVRSPDQPTYVSGTEVTLTAVADVGASFVGWSGHVSSTDVEVTVTVGDGPVSVDAEFTEAPSSYPVDVSVSGDGSVVRSPDQVSYVSGSEVTLTATPEAGASFVGWSGDVSSTDAEVMVTVGDGPVGVSADFTLVPPPPTGFVSDDFDSPQLGAQWTLIDPVGDGSLVLQGAGTGQATVSLSVTDDDSHDPWHDNDALRLMQPLDDGDFELEVAFVNEPSLRYQSQGLLVEQDAGDWVRFDVYHDGSNLRLFSAITEDGDSSAEFSTPVASGVRFLRVGRVGDVWTFSYSGDGAAWTQAGSYSHALAVSTAGVFAGNAGPDPAHTAVVDYVFETSSPIDPEDGTVGPPSYPVDVSVSGDGSVVRSPDQPTYVSGTEVTLTAVADAGASFVGWSGDVSSTDAEVTVTVGDGPVSVDAEFTEAPPGPSGIDVWYGSTQTFGDGGVSQPWVNILGNAADPQGVASLTYRLNGGTTRSLNLGPDLRRLQEPGDFNIDIDVDDLSVGQNTVVIRLTDGTGDITDETVTVVWAPSGASLPLTVDWSASGAIGDAVQVVDGLWEIEGGQAATVEIGYDRALALGDGSWQDFEVSMPVTFLGVDDPGTSQSGAPLIGFGLRWQGHSTVSGAQPHWGFYPAGAYAFYRLQQGGRLTINGNDGFPVDHHGQPLLAGTTYIFKARAETVTGGTRYQFKVWQQGQAEPGYTNSIVETDGPSSGSVLLLAHHFDLRFGDVTVTPL